MTVQHITGDCRDKLRTLPAGSVQCIVTSPPYWGLRDYRIPPSVWGGDPACRHRFAKERTSLELRKGAGLAVLGAQMKGGGHKQAGMAGKKFIIERGFCRCGAWRGCYGLEPTYQLYIAHTVEIFREVWRVLREDGTLWLNMGDCYATHRAGWPAAKYKEEGWDHRFVDKPFDTSSRKRASDGNGRSTPGRAHGRIGSNGAYHGPEAQPNRDPQPGLKPKDLAGMPWRVAFALQADGWWLRRDIIWHKKNPMPESVCDRPTTAHEYLFQFSKSGDTLLWRHDLTRQWVETKPEPDWRWRHRITRDVTDVPQAGEDWFKFNLWSGFDYYYEYEAIMEPSSPDSHARAAKIKFPGGWDLGEGAHGTINRSGRTEATYVGIGHNARPTKGVPNGAVGRPQDERWKPGGPNSRFAKDRIPDNRKSHAGYDGPRPKNNANADASLKARDRKLADYGDGRGPRPKQNESFFDAIGCGELVPMRNKRSVWSIATKPFKEAHFATFPPSLVEPCILAGCPNGGVVLDPFGGAGTVGLVADQLGRNAILIELNPAYAKMAQARIARGRMGPEEKKRATIKSSGKLKRARDLPLFRKRKSVTRDEESVPAPLLLPALR